MSNIYHGYASQLQSRIAKRASKLTENTMWKVGYRSLGRMQDWRESKKIIAALTSEQVLDKALLKLAHAAAAEWEYSRGDNLWREELYG